MAVISPTEPSHVCMLTQGYTSFLNKTNFGLLLQSTVSSKAGVLQALQVLQALASQWQIRLHVQAQVTIAYSDALQCVAAVGVFAQHQ